VRTLGGDLALVINEEKILKVFRITALTQVFSIHPSLEEALA
jgi:anti-sigma B factor antagonist